MEEILDGLTRTGGWQVLRELPTPEATVRCLVTGPAGAFSVETRVQPGAGRIDTVPQAWLQAARAQAAAAEHWLGAGVQPLLVLRLAELDRSGGVRDGVTVVAANDLATHLRTSGRRVGGAAARGALVSLAGPRPERAEAAAAQGRAT